MPIDTLAGDAQSTLKATADYLRSNQGDDGAKLVFQEISKTGQINTLPSCTRRKPRTSMPSGHSFTLSRNIFA
jgi:hypothetical protein